MAVVVVSLAVLLAVVQAAPTAQEDVALLQEHLAPLLSLNSNARRISREQSGRAADEQCSAARLQLDQLCMEVRPTQTREWCKSPGSRGWPSSCPEPAEEAHCIAAWDSCNVPQMTPATKVAFKEACCTESVMTAEAEEFHLSLAEERTKKPPAPATIATIEEEEFEDAKEADEEDSDKDTEKTASTEESASEESEEPAESEETATEEESDEPAAEESEADEEDSPEETEKVAALEESTEESAPEESDESAESEETATPEESDEPDASEESEETAASEESDESAEDV